MAKHVGAKAAAAAKDEKAKQDSQKNAQADTHGTKEEKEMVGVVGVHPTIPISKMVMPVA